MSYEQAFERALRDPEGFWAEAAEAIDWDRRWAQTLDTTATPSGRWFRGGRLNTCYNALDRHVEAGRGEQPALIYDSPVTGQKGTLSYRALRDEVALFAGALARLGLKRGDRVIVYMPMVPEAVVAMLACARLGAVHSVVFGGFAAPELAARIDDAQPRLIVAGSCGIEPGRRVEYKPMLDRALALATHRPERCIVLQRPEGPCSLNAGRDITWEEALVGAEPHPCVSVEATDPLYVLYTSGTTGRPKGVVRDNGGHAVALAWSMRHIYGLEPGEVYWAASDVGWVVGHSYIVYGPLLHGCTTVLYEGKPVGTPDPGAFWRVASEHGVAVLFAAPTALRAIKKEDPAALHRRRYDLGGLRALFLAGERCDPDTLNWATGVLERPVVDHWWQTETGWPMAANFPGLELLPVKPGSSGRPVPGYDVRVLAPDLGEVAPGTVGNITVRLPLPPGCLTTLWNRDADFRAGYLDPIPGHFVTGDWGCVDAEGYLHVMGRVDDIINVAGHRLSSGAMEEVLASHPAVAECAVIGVADELRGTVPVGLVVVKQGCETDPAALCEELVTRVREHIGPTAVFRKVAVVDRLPKTRSGKILRAVMRKIADGEPWQTPATIDDPAVLGEVGAALRAIGYGLPERP